MMSDSLPVNHLVGQLGCYLYLWTFKPQVKYYINEIKLYFKIIFPLRNHNVNIARFAELAC